ncbi:hypothetical protein [Candidatus Nitrotoga fabula]|uniref:hypothetical protein n=1 Tax=Candidatus Nitrotoga fabula TaxID=2182327 RepID=UPI001BB4786E|nr:hypothetical protein [Candidatus Nitrotoga fabula]
MLPLLYLLGGLCLITLGKISAEQDARHAAKLALQVALADAMACNASQTLDGQHGDNHFAQDFLGKVLTHCLTLNHWYHEKNLKSRTGRRACRFEFGSTDDDPRFVFLVRQIVNDMLYFQGTGCSPA